MYKLVKIEGSVKVLATPAALGQHNKNGFADAKRGVEAQKQQICALRGKRVMLDSDAAAFYGIETEELLRQVRKNRMRFPENYMFRLNQEEYNSLLSQSPALREKARSKQPPFAFTEAGVVMLATVIGSYKAVEMAFKLVDDFTRQRESAGIQAALFDSAAGTDKKFGLSEGANSVVQEPQAALYGQH